MGSLNGLDLYKAGAQDIQCAASGGAELCARCTTNMAVLVRVEPTSCFILQCKGHEALPDHALEVRARHKLLPHITALAEGNGVQPIQIVL